MQPLFSLARAVLGEQRRVSPLSVKDNEIESRFNKEVGARARYREVINERRYKSRPLVSAGRLFRADRFRNEGARSLALRPVCA